MGYTGPETLQSAVGATGVGLSMPVAALAAVACQITIADTATVTFEVTVDGTNWVSLQMTNVATGTAATTATASGIYRAPVVGAKLFRANVSSWTSGAVTAVALGSTLSFSSGGGGGESATYASAKTFSANGAVSTPAVSLTGIPFAGTGTTSFPLLYLNNSGATASTTLSTAGTAFGINSHGTPDLMNLMVDGVSQFKVSSTGTGTFTGQVMGPVGSVSAPGLAISSNYGLYVQGGGLKITAGGAFSAEFNQNGNVYINRLIMNQTNADITFNRLAAASLQLGAAASATPVAYTLTVGESSRGGTDTNVAGAGATFQPGAGTGTGATVPFILKAPVQVASGTGAQTQTEWARGQAVGTAIGCSFFGVASVVRQTVGANVNNVAASGTTGQFDDFTNGTVYATDYAALHATVYQLARSVAQLTVAVRNYGLGV